MPSSKPPEIERRFPESIGPTSPLDERATFTHTGVLGIRINAATIEDAREMLAAAASAALEAAPGIVLVEGTHVASKRTGA